MSTFEEVDSLLRLILARFPFLLRPGPKVKWERGLNFAWTVKPYFYLQKSHCLKKNYTSYSIFSGATGAGLVQLFQ